MWKIDFRKDFKHLLMIDLFVYATIEFSENGALRIISTNPKKKQPS